MFCYFLILTPRPPSPAAWSASCSANRVRLLLTCASLRRPLLLSPPPPPETNLIPSWLWEEAEATARMQREKRQKKGGAGASRRWLLLGGRQQGEQRHSQVPSLEHILHVSAISPHHTDTHAGLQRHVLQAEQRETDRRAHLPFVAAFFFPPSPCFLYSQQLRRTRLVRFRGKKRFVGCSVCAK